MGLTLNGNAEPGASYAYDQGGRMTQKTEGSSSEAMQYGLSGPEHAVWSLASGGHDDILHYDANGNLCSYWADGSDFTCNPPAGNSMYAYDAENRITSRSDAAGGNDTYTYDAGGTLVMRTMYDGSYTLYIGGIYEEDHAAGGTVVGVRKYYQMNGRTVAVRHAADASGTGGVLSYTLRDHLGSIAGLVDTAGNVEPGTATTYWPYGAVRTGGLDSSAESDRQFTGQRIETGDAALGLYNYNARFYSTTLGAFVSADSATDGLNRYSYVHDNPVRYADPTGHRSSDIEDEEAFNRALVELAQLRDSLPTQAQRDSFTEAMRGEAPEIDETQVTHGWRTRDGLGLEPTEENRVFVRDIASNPANLKAIYKNGTRDYAIIQPDGSEVVVRVGGATGKIRMVAVNESESTWVQLKDGDYQRISGAGATDPESDGLSREELDPNAIALADEAEGFVTGGGGIPGAGGVPGYVSCEDLGLCD